jgi:hypothetical protein
MLLAQVEGCDVFTKCTLRVECGKPAPIFIKSIKIRITAYLLVGGDMSWCKTSSTASLLFAVVEKPQQMGTAVENMNNYRP